MTDEDKVTAALIGAAGALVTAVVTALLGARAASRGSAEAARQQEKLARLEAALAERHAEREAFREYQYEARKRLYFECEPLLFQLLVLARDAISRIGNLAKVDRNGDLGRNGWLSRGYYSLSTYYRLLAPLAVYRVLNRRLGLIDLTLDQRIYLKYSIVRRAYNVLGDDFKIARKLGLTGYDPHDEQAAQLRANEPHLYWQQGVPEGILANAVDSLLFTDAQGRERIMTFADFENAYDAPGSTVHAAIARIGYLFADFAPRSRPILWTILLVHRALYVELLRGADPVAREMFGLGSPDANDDDSDLGIELGAISRDQVRAVVADHTRAGRPPAAPAS